MKVGITVWGERISPVFDSARTLLVGVVEKGEVVERQLEIFRADRLVEFVRLLSQNGITVLICGAISHEPASYIEAEGITLIPFITGYSEQILTSYVKGASIITYRMPGCRDVGGTTPGMADSAAAGGRTLSGKQPTAETFTKYRRYRICQV